jgi:hypothetical protein
VDSAQEDRGGVRLIARRILVELLFWLIVGGIVGTVFMDIADKLMARMKFTTGAA